MNWITKRYDQSFLVVSAVGLLVSAGFILFKAQNFGNQFSSLLLSITPQPTISESGIPDPIGTARTKLEAPPAWTPTKENPKGLPALGSLFVAHHYVVDNPRLGPQKVGMLSFYKDSLTHQPIPNAWFLEHGLPVTDPTVAMQDPDKDGFTNQDEWRANTDPNDKASHPPYYTKLFFDKVIRVPFRLLFQGYDGIPNHDPLNKFTFQINSLDLYHPTLFEKIGDVLPKTNWRVDNFAFKQVDNEQTKDRTDVSELTLVNTESSEKMVLIKNQVTNSPTVFAEFSYEWPRPAQMIRVKQGEDFMLRPEADETHHYKLLDVTDTEARIQLPSGETYTVKHR